MRYRIWIIVFAGKTQKKTYRGESLDLLET